MHEKINIRISKELKDKFQKTIQSNEPHMNMSSKLKQLIHEYIKSTSYGGR